MIDVWKSLCLRSGLLAARRLRVIADRTGGPASTTSLLADTVKQRQQPPPLLGG
jgi:hypothetical protein